MLILLSRQIRPPIYSLKQTKLRKRRVIRYAILYFVILVVFIALIAGPIVAGKFLSFDISIPMELLQPTGLGNNDTSASATGSCVGGMKCPEGPGGDSGSSSARETGSSNRLARFMAH